MAKEYKEYILSTDAYKNPKKYTGAMATGLIITRLLLLEPGTNPLHPGMGVGLGPKYRFIGRDYLPILHSKILEQFNTYLPYDITTNMKLYLDINDNNYLVITTIVDNTKFIYNTENTETPVSVSSLS